MSKVLTVVVACLVVGFLAGSQWSARTGLGEDALHDLRQSHESLTQLLSSQHKLEVAVDKIKERPCLLGKPSSATSLPVVEPPKPSHVAKAPVAPRPVSAGSSGILSASADEPRDNGIHSKTTTRAVSNKFPPPRSFSISAASSSGRPNAALCNGVTESSSGSFSRNIPGGRDFLMCHHGPTDVIGSAWMHSGGWGDCVGLIGQAFLAYAVSDYRSPDGLPNVVDVGANVGSCSMYFLNQGFCPTAFEPAPSNMKLFVASAEANHYTCGEKVFAGAALEEKTFTIRITPNNKGHAMLGEGHQEAPGLLAANTINEEIQLTRLDNVVKLHVHFMKVDVQGFEEQAITSADGFFKEFEPPEVIIFEINPSLMGLAKSNPMNLIRWLHRWGYKIVGTKGSAKVLTESDLESEFASMARRPLAETNYIAIGKSMQERSTIDKFYQAASARIHCHQWASSPDEWKSWARTALGL